MNTDTLLELQDRFFATGTTRRIAERRKALLSLQKGIRAMEKDILAAMKKDLGRPETEAYGTEVGLVLEDLGNNLANLKNWSSKRPMPTPEKLLFWSRSYLRPEPKGRVLVLAPWNYPFFLTLLPAISAIAAGNTVVIKPSEVAPASAGVIHDLISRHMPPEWATVVNGGSETAEALLKHRWDHILFTGSGRVGRLVLRAAAETLSPVTLELGGKCPAIVDGSANLKVAARRIAFGKWLNAGQTCLAPDHVLVHTSVYEAFKKELSAALDKFTANEEDLSHQIHRTHFERQEALAAEGKIVWSGPRQAQKLLLGIQVIEGVAAGSRCATEEIFGPVLPLFEYRTEEELTAQLRSQPSPLAVYLFAERRSLAARLEKESRCGTFVLNEAVLQTANYHLPFGGIGASGMGVYRGEAGFNAFSHLKPVVRSNSRLDLPFRYPPYRGKLKWVRRLLG